MKKENSAISVLRLYVGLKLITEGSVWKWVLPKQFCSGKLLQIGKNTF